MTAHKKYEFLKMVYVLRYQAQKKKGGGRKEKKKSCPSNVYDK